METNNRPSSSERKKDVISTSFAALSVHSPIDTTQKLQIRKKYYEISKLYKSYKERFGRYTTELRTVSSIIKREKKQVISYYEYAEIGEQEAFTQKYKWIEINFPHDTEVMKKLSQFSVDELNDLEISVGYCFEEKYKYLEKFMATFNSTNIKTFMISGCCISSEFRLSELKMNTYSGRPLEGMLPCSSFFIGLREVAFKTTKVISMRKLEFCSKEFSLLVRAAKQVEKLSFKDCEILTNSVIDFRSMEGCQMKRIDIENCDKVYKDLNEYESILMNIFTSILNCYNMMKSLERINFNCSDEMKVKLLEKAEEVLGEECHKTMPSLKFMQS